MTAVVVRTARRDAVQIDPQRQPSGRKTSQAKGRITRRKGRAVVAADDLGKPVLGKNPRKLLANRLGSRVGRGLGTEDVTAAIVADRQRLKTFSVPRVPPALEIDRPKLVGPFDLDPVLQPPALLASLAATTMTHQAGFVQHPLEGALRGQLALPGRTREQLANLGRAPVGPTIDFPSAQTYAPGCWIRFPTMREEP